MITIQRYHPDKKNQWNDFVASSKNATFLFNRDYVDYHQDRFIDHSILVFDEQELVAILPANEKEDIIYSHGGLSYGGLILKPTVRLQEVLGFFFHLLKYYADLGFKQLTYKCFPSFLASFPAQEDLYALYLLRAELVRRDSGCVSPLQQQLPYQQRRTRSIKRAEKSAVWVRETANPSFFWEHILSPTLWQRHQLKPVHTMEEINLLHNRFTQQIRIFEAGVETALAGTVIFETATTAHAQYIAALPEGRENGAIDLLFHTLLSQTFKHKQFFSFGISNENNGNYLNTGLQDWKEGLGGRTYALDCYTVQLSNHSALKEYA